MGDAIYLYCFTYAGLLPQLEGLGTDGEHPLFSFAYNEVAAVLSTVSALEFCGPEAEAKFHDLTWIGPRVCRHQEVIAQVMRCSPALPARFGTIFYSIASLEGRLRTHYYAILQFLDRMVGKEEWGVKVMWDRNRAREELFAIMIADQAQGMSSSPGMRYFQEQKMRGEVEKNLHSWLKATCDEVAGGVEGLVSETYARKVLPGRVAEDNKEMFCNWAVLIPLEDLPKLREYIAWANDKYGSGGLVFELSGPWPPYSFCPLLEAEAPA
jgi:hypothetical protein